MTKCGLDKYTRSEVVAGRVEQHDVVSNITKENSGYSVGQLLRGVAKVVPTIAKRLFGETSVRHFMTALESTLPNVGPMSPTKG